jgi:uncharacterized protein (TIGR02145 family)
MRSKTGSLLIACSALMLFSVNGYTQDMESTTVKDYDKNVYRVVTIGTQIWMAENLKVTHYRNGEPVPLVTDNSKWASLSDGAYCTYDNKPGNAKSYGFLYNWYAVSNSGGLCPAGWHVPTANDWKKLEATLGGVGGAGGKMKEKGTAHWEMPNAKADNSSGFTALPGGSRTSDGIFETIRETGHWWTSNEFSVTSAWHRSIYCNAGFIDNIYGYKTDGYSVRCLRDK